MCELCFLQCEALNVTFVSWVQCRTAPLSVTCQSGGTEVWTNVQQYNAEQRVGVLLKCDVQVLSETFRFFTVCLGLTWHLGSEQKCAWVVSSAAVFSRAEIYPSLFLHLSRGVLTDVNE